MMLFNPVYSAVVNAGRKGETWFLDIGCCSECGRLGHLLCLQLNLPVGTDVRKLILDGYRAANVAACDLRSTFIDIGRDKERGLFRDADSCEITFFAADILELSLSRSSGRQSVKRATLRETAAAALDAGATFGLESLKGCLNHVYTGALFHLFDEDTQYAIALRVALLLDLKQRGEEGTASKAGCVVFGRHQGKEEAGVIDDDMGRCVQRIALLDLHYNNQMSNCVYLEYLKPPLRAQRRDLDMYVAARLHRARRRGIRARAGSRPSRVCSESRRQARTQVVCVERIYNLM